MRISQERAETAAGCGKVARRFRGRYPLAECPRELAGHSQRDRANLQAHRSLWIRSVLFQHRARVVHGVRTSPGTGSPFDCSTVWLPRREEAGASPDAGFKNCHVPVLKLVKRIGSQPVSLPEIAGSIPAGDTIAARAARRAQHKHCGLLSAWKLSSSKFE